MPVSFSPGELYLIIVLNFSIKRKIKRFYPTRLAIQLANGINDSVEVNKEDKGYIIVETNYRIYAYTGSYYTYSIVKTRLSRINYKK